MESRTLEKRLVPDTVFCNPPSAAARPAPWPIDREAISLDKTTLSKTMCKSMLSGLCLPLLFGCASVEETPRRIALYGDLAPVTAAGTSIVIRPDTRFVNVTGGDITRFVVGDKAFAWNFDGPLEITSFDLRTVAPPGMLDHSVVAYIAPNPYRTGSGGHHGGYGGGHGGQGR